MVAMTTPYYAAACQTDFACPASRDEIAERTSHMCKMAEQAITGYEPFHDVRLLAFPEFAHAAPVYDSIAKLRNRHAVPLPNEHTNHYHRTFNHQNLNVRNGKLAGSPRLVMANISVWCTSENDFQDLH